MKTYILLFFTMLSFGCHQDTNEATVIDAYIDLFILDNESNDLLDSSNSNHIDLSKVEIYYVVDGKKEKQHNTNMGVPSSYFLFPPEQVPASAGLDSVYTKYYGIRLFLNLTDTENPTKTIVQWNETDSDIFTSEMRRWDNGISCQKLWVNDSLIRDVAGATTANLNYYIITK